MIKIYIASPYTIGNKEENVKRQIEVANQLMDLKYCPFTPLLSHYHNSMFERSYEDWMEIDFEWIKSCDGILRLEGESRGADAEIEFAKQLGISVFYSIEDLEEYKNKGSFLYL
jgi:hypothetical protein